MNPPGVEELANTYLTRSLDTQRVARFDEIFRDIGSEDSDLTPRDETIGSWVEDAEKWENIPRTAYVVDYWNPPEILMNYLKEFPENENTDPGLKGVKLAQNLIEAARISDSASYGYLLEVDTSEPDPQLNLRQAGSPTEIHIHIPLPEEYQEDDTFTVSEESEKVGILTDDPTVLARQGFDAAKYLKEQENYEIPFEFIEGMKETIESYLPTDF